MVFVKNLTLEMAESINNKYPRLAVLLNYIKENGCPMCKFHPVDYDNFEFHMYSTHGIPKDVILMWIKEEDLK